MGRKTWMWPTSSTAGGDRCAEVRESGYRLMDNAASGAPRRLWFVLALLVLMLIGVTGYKVWPLLHSPLLLIAEPDSGCDLRSGPCEARFSDGARVRLEIRPNTIPTAVPLSIEVALSGLEAQSVEIDFQGVDMYMGFNRAALSQTEPGRYLGQAMIPVCVRTRMTWEARVLIHTPDGLLAAPFRFDTWR